MQLSVGILSGGKSTRMGENKAWKIYQGKTLLERKIEEFQSSDELLVSVDKREKYERITKCRIIEDTYRSIGPMGGIYELLLHSTNKWVFITSVDTPLIDRRYVEYLSQFIEEKYECIIVKNKYLEPLNAIYRKDVYQKIRKSIDQNQYKIQIFLTNLKLKEINLKYTIFQEVLFNINTLEDYKKLKEIPILSICGRKNTGKTTLISALVKKFKLEDCRISVIKHDGHEFDISGTDSDIFFKSGASPTILYSDTKYMRIENKSVIIEQIIQSIKDVQLIIIEGLKNENYSKIELIKNGEIVSNKNNLIAVIGNHPDYPSFHREDVQAIYNFIKKEFGI